MKLAKIFHKRYDKKNGIAWLVAISGLFLALTLPTLAKASIWFDEAFSAYLIRYDFSKIWHYTSVDVHPPLYYFALKTWSLIFGTSDFALRSMSVFFGILTIFVSFCFIRKIFGKKSAVISTTLLAISPMFVRYAQEMRMYMMVAFFAVLSVWAFYEIYIAKNSEKEKKKWRLIFVVSSAAGIWTQYLSGLTLLALWFVRGFIVRKGIFKNIKKRKLLEAVKVFFAEKWFMLNFWTAVIFLPWIPFFLTQAVSVKSAFWIQDLSFNTLPNYISNFFTFVNSGDLNAWWSMVIFAILGLLSWGASKLPKSERANFALVGALSILPPVLLFLLSLPPAKSIFVDRYALAGMIFSAISIGVLVSKIYSKNRKISIWIFVLTLVSFAYGNFEIYRQSGFSKTSNSTTETRQIVEFIHERAKAGEPIVVTSGYFYYEVAKYSTDKNKVWFTAEQDYRVGSLKMLEEDNGNKISDLGKFSKKHSEIWVIYGYGETKKPPLHKDWNLEFEQTFGDRIIGGNRYLVQKFSTKN